MEVDYMGYVSPELLEKAKQMDLLTYLKNYEPNEISKGIKNTILHQNTR